MDVAIIWDLEDDPDGNVQHLLEHGVSMDEAEDVLRDRNSTQAVSRSSGYPMVFGWTSKGRHLAIVYELVDSDPMTFRPITAYETQPSSRKKRGRKP